TIQNNKLITVFLLNPLKRSSLLTKKQFNQCITLFLCRFLSKKIINILFKYQLVNSIPLTECLRWL
ncbi:hypothetical protein ET304_15410, partial [Salmonella enterica]|nr:hypothetical protein [Salmonella enterica]